MTHKIYIAIYHVKMGAGKILLTISDLTRLISIVSKPISIVVVVIVVVVFVQKS